MKPLPALLTAALATLAAVPAMAEVPAVVADTPVVQSLAEKVMGDLGTPEVLVSGGAEPHSYQLRPSQARALADADVILWVGPEMTPWLPRALETNEGGTVLGLLAAPGTKLRQFAPHGGEEPEGEAHEDHDGDHDEEGHDHHGTDPHAWLDPANARVWVAAIRDALVAADPANAATYTANADAALADLTTLEAELTRTLAGAGKAPFIVGHDAYGYLADRFGLTIAASIEAGDAAEPGAAHLAEVADLVASKGVTCLFPEAGHDPARSAMLVADSGAKLGAPLDPEGLRMLPGPDLYDRLMRDIAGAIAACLAG